MIRQAALAVGLAAALAGCATTSSPARKVLATATILAPDGTVKGHATLGTAGEGMDLNLDVDGFQPGVHGTHLHMTGACVPRDFTSAGGHLNPTGRKHGTMNPDGSHMGDLPNLTVAPDGRGGMSARLEGDRKTLESGLFDADGTAIVIHAGPDDYRTDPSGNSGSRIACGVFARVR